jgi:hypothetical protein
VLTFAVEQPDTVGCLMQSLGFNMPPHGSLELPTLRRIEQFACQEFPLWTERGLVIESCAILATRTLHSPPTSSGRRLSTLVTSQNRGIF